MQAVQEQGQAILLVSNFQCTFDTTQQKGTQT